MKRSVRWLEKTVEFRKESDFREVLKRDLRPLCGGWLDGIDPYPNLSDDDVAQRIFFDNRITIKGDCICAAGLAVGDIVEFQGKEFTVFRLQSTNLNALRHTVEAIHYANNTEPASFCGTGG